jgi:hypothetical protein
MKKARWFTLLTIITILSVFVLSGCDEKEDKVSSVSLKDHDPGNAVEIALGELDYSQYTVVVSYESGNSEEVALSEEMIAEADIFKLYQVGEHDITISYAEQKYTFKVSVKRATFGDLSFPENNVFTYDGKPHTVEVDGEIPANAVITYIGGNSFVNAGTYDVIAVVFCEGYVTEKLSTTVKIERAKYDMSGVKFEGKEVVYDGTAHSVAISGTLPEGVSSPTYTINEKTTSSATDVGEYTVKAKFANDNPNYEAIPEMEATLKITPAEYTVKGVDIVFRDGNGNTLSDASKIYDGKNITFDLNDYAKLSKKISVSFSVCDKDGNVISTSNKNTEIVNAGVYTVKAEFTLEDSKNYKPIDPIIRTFEVLKADYPPVENIDFISSQTTYDGKEHSIAIEGQLPNGVTVSYEYYLDGVLIVDGEGNPVQAVVNAGRYTVKAVFSHTDANRKEIEPVSAALRIEQGNINVLTWGFEYNQTWVYDGTAKSVVNTRKPEYVEISYEYYLNEELVTNEDGTPASAVTEVGEYTVKVIINVTNNNYAPMEPIILTFAIVAQNN